MSEKKNSNQNSDSLYLDKIKYDPSQENTIIAYLINNARAVFLGLILIIAFGTFAFINLPREVNPEIEISIVNVSVAFPGASPSDIEELIVQPIEDEVASISEVDTIDSSSREGVGIVTITFFSNVVVEDAVQDVKEKVDLISFPDDATDPIVQSIDFSSIPIINLTLYSNSDRISLAKVTEVLKDRLENESEIDEVSTFGLSEEEIIIDIDIPKLQELNVSPSFIVQSLNSNDITFPSGEITVNDTNYQLSVNNSFETIEDVRNQTLMVNGSPVFLYEIADVRFRENEDIADVFFTNKEDGINNAVQIRIFKTKGQEIDVASNVAQEIIASTLEEYPNINIYQIEDISEDIEEQFGELGSNFLTTIILVFLVLFIFIGAKQATIASISIPLTFLSAFAIMFASGITMNFLSLFSLLLALGLVVDDAIVIVSAYTSYSRSGKFKTPKEVGLMVYRDFKVPIYTTTLTTVWAFVPLLLSSGIIGEFIKSIPVVVTATLISSTSIAVFLNIPLVVILDKIKIPTRVKVLGYSILGIIGVSFIYSIVVGTASVNSSGTERLLRFLLFILLVVISIWSVTKHKFSKNKPKNDQKVLKDDSFWPKFLPKRKNKTKEQPRKDFKHYIENGIVDLSKIRARYSKLLSRILFSTKRSLGIFAITLTFVFVSISFVVAGLVPNEFFPAEEVEILYVNIEGQSGWDKDNLRSSVESITERVITVEEVLNITSVTGTQIGNDADLASGSNYAYLTIKLKPDIQRDDNLIADEIREKIADIDTVKTNVLLIGGGGPPAGADLQVNIRGEELEELERLSNEFVQVIESNENTTNVSTSFVQSPGQISVDLINVEVTKRGLSAIEIANWLRTIVAGTEVGEIGNGDDEIPIVVKSGDDVNIASLSNLVLPGNMGGYSLGEIAEIKLVDSLSEIRRSDQKRVVNVTAAVEGIAPTIVFADLEEQFNQIELPAGYEWSTGGVNEQNEDSITEIVQQMQIAFMLILITVVLQLNSFRKAFMVLSIIPLAVSGVFFGFFLFQIPLSFPAIIGLLSLFGIVVNNTIMLVEKINQNEKIGLGFVESIVDACSSRTEPILFTTLTTIMGLLPITISDPLWRGLGGAIISGLSVSGIIILFFLPVLYKFIYDFRMWGRLRRRWSS